MTMHLSGISHCKIIVYIQGRFQTGGVWGVLPTLAGKWGGVGGVFFGKIRHNEQKLSISLTFFPFIFDQMFTSSSF